MMMPTNTMMTTAIIIITPAPHPVTTGSSIGSEGGGTVYKVGRDIHQSAIGWYNVHLVGGTHMHD